MWRNQISKNGILVALTLTAAGFLFYYLWLYSDLVTAYENGFFLSRFAPMAGENRFSEKVCGNKENRVILFVNFPLYLARFSDRKMELVVSNGTGKLQRGIISIHGEIYGEIPESKALEAINSDRYRISISSKSDANRDADVSYVSYYLPACSSQRFNIQVSVENSPDVDEPVYAMFSFFQQELGQQPDQHVDRISEWQHLETLYELAEGLPPPVNRISEWQQTEILCEIDGLKPPKEAGVYLCSKIDSYAMLRYTLIEQLLLPPWSNGMIPLLILFVVWASERILERIRVFNAKEDEDEKKYYKLLRGREVLKILFLSAIFLLICIQSIYNALLLDRLDSSALLSIWGFWIASSIVFSLIFDGIGRIGLRSLMYVIRLVRNARQNTHPRNERPMLLSSLTNNPTLGTARRIAWMSLVIWFALLFQQNQTGALVDLSSAILSHLITDIKMQTLPPEALIIQAQSMQSLSDQAQSTQVPISQANPNPADVKKKLYDDIYKATYGQISALMPLVILLSFIPLFISTLPIFWLRFGRVFCHCLMSYLQKFLASLPCDTAENRQKWLESARKHERLAVKEPVNIAGKNERQLQGEVA